jgi:PAS domain S-box-containing protein
MPNGNGDKFYNLYESILEGIVSVSMDGRITDANKAYLDMLGYDLGELKTLTYQQITPVRWHAMEQQIVDTQLATRGYTDEYEKEYVRKDGSVFPVSLRTWLVRDEAGKPSYMWAIVRDISERKAYELQLEEARDNWEKSFQAIGDAMLLVDEKLNIIQHNDAFARLVGHESEDLRGQQCYRLVHDLDSAPDFCVTCAAREEGKSVSAELYEPFLEKHLAASADPRFDETGKFEFALHVIRDISERKNSEDALRQSEERFRGILENAPFGYYRVGRDGLWQYVNPVWERMHGFTSEEVIGKPFEITQPDGAVDQARELVARTLSGETISGEFGRLTKEGETEYHRYSIQPVRSGDEIIAIEGFIDDITEQRRVEEALRESEERYRQIVDHAVEGIFQTTPDGRLLSANPAFVSMYGYESPRQMVEEVTDITTQLYDDPAHREEITQQLARDGSVTGKEVRFRRRDGSKLWVSINAHLVKDDEGNVLYFEGTTEDITQRREAEEHLRIAKFEVEKAGDMILRNDRDGLIIDANESACRTYGYTLDEMVGLHVWDIDRDITEQGWREIWQERKAQGGAHFQTVCRRKDGTEFQAEMTLSYLEFEGNEYFVVMGRDISVEKRADEEREEAERKYEELAESLPQVVFELDNMGRVVYVNRAGLEMFGFEEHDIGAMHTLDIIEEVDQDRVSGAIDKMMDGRSTGAIREYLAKRKDGSTFPAMAFSTLVEDNDGNPAGIRGILTDISERKKYEEALEASEKKYRELANSLPEIVFEIEKSGVFTYVNESGANRFGYTPDELVGKMTPMDVMAPEDKSRGIQAMQTLMKEGKVDPAEYRVLSKDGESFDAMIYSKLAMRDGEPFGMSGIVMDISERKRYEEELQQANVELDGFAHTVSHDLKGPLSVIGFAGELLSQNIDEPMTSEIKEIVHDATEMLNKNVGKATDLIEDLLSLAEAGHKPVRVTKVNVRDVVENVLDENAVALRKMGIKVKVGEDLGSVRANQTHVYQIFANLVRNAIYHSGADYPEIEIKRLPTIESKAHRFLVKDNGVGIPSDKIHKIFIPFFRGPDGGTGIGLSTVQKAVRLYGGWIRAYNDDGACFEFVIKDWPNGD